MSGEDLSAQVLCSEDVPATIRSLKNGALLCLLQHLGRRVPIGIDERILGYAINEAAMRWQRETRKRKAKKS